MAWKRRLRALGGLSSVLAAVVFLSSLSPCPAQPLAASRTVSRGGDFIVYSSDRTLRNNLVRTAESALAEWKKIVDADVGSLMPILIQDKSRAGRPRGTPALVTGIFETDGGGIKVQIDLYDTAALRAGAFEVEIFRSLALHAMHKKDPPRAGKAYARPPGWFVEGLAEELRRKGGEVPDGVYAALIRTERPPDLKRFFTQKSEILDATSLALYRAEALALLRVLQKANDSKDGFATLLASPAFPKADASTVLRAFPSLGGDPAQLSKMWTLAIARSSMPAGLASLNVEQTNNELRSILDFSPGTGAQGADTPAALPEKAIGEGGAYLMRQRSVELLNLAFRGHPLLRPVIDEYRAITMLLERKPKANVAARIEDIEKIRTLLVERHKKISDYLNWFEATQVDISEHPLLEQVQTPETPPRTDPYSIYLDSFEKSGR